MAIRSVRHCDRWTGVWILNPDTEVAANALSSIVSYAASGRYGLVGCRTVSPHRNTIQQRGGGTWAPLMARSKSVGLSEAVDLPVDVKTIEEELDWISGAAAYATREFVETVGLMEEKYFLYMEDVEWSLRRGKFRLGYAHDAIVYHAQGTSTDLVPE